MPRLIPLLALFVACAPAPPPTARIAAPEDPTPERVPAAEAPPEPQPIAAPPGPPEPLAECPTGLGGVAVTEQALELAEPIYFDTGKPTVKEESLSLVDDVAAVLVACPGITIEIGVHTDPRGSSAWNLRLSQERAEDLARQLIERGVEAERLVARGYGESCPVHSEAQDPQVSWRLSRRTELRRTDSGLAGGCPPPEPPPPPEAHERQRH